MTIWLASYPRSGNTLMRLWMQRWLQVPSRRHYAKAITAAGNALERYLAEAEPADPEPAGPVLVKTHELPSGDLPALYIVRDGRDALVSYAHYALTPEIGNGSAYSRADFLEQLRSLIVTDDYYGGWSRHVNAWMDRSAPTAIVKFEDLTVNPRETISAALERIGLRVEPDNARSAPDFEDLHAQFPWFFRKGRTGGWHDEMPASLHYLFWARHGATMRRLGYITDMPPMDSGSQLSMTAAWTDREIAAARHFEQFRKLHEEIDTVRRQHAGALELAETYRRAAEERLDALLAADAERRRLLEIAEERLALIQRLNEQLCPAAAESMHT